MSHISHIIEQAGREIILPAFNRSITSQLKTDGSIVTETDTLSQSWMKHQLHQLDASIAFLGEEMSEQEQRQKMSSSGRFWCLDPLDGTTNFSAGIPVFGTSLALIEDGKPLLACIHDPVRQETFTAIKHAGASLNGVAIHITHERELACAVGFIDFKRLEQAQKELFLQKNLYRSQRNIGTCALEWAWLAAGRGHFIVHGGEKIWDYAAGSLIAEEAGCQVSNFSNGALFDRLKMTQSILAASPAIHQPLLDIIRNTQANFDHAV
ncbi:MAG: inositol monophosphatase [Zetaproteobacteria bacterium CG1_02_49_23]|nr:MAG: inositol monophosphatase [Zetaproteobacteria bacterium CG1_02_49_23]